MELTHKEKIVLGALANTPGGIEIDEMNEQYRQTVIDLGMKEPPLVVVQDGLVEATVQGVLTLPRK